MTSAIKRGMVLAALVLGACDSVAPSSAPYGNLQAHVSIQPEVVARGEQFAVRVALINPTDLPIEYVNSIGCAVTFEYLRLGVDFKSAFRNASGGCLAAPIRFTVPAQDSVVMVKSPLATAPAGVYKVRALLGGQDPKDALVARLQVR